MVDADLRSTLTFGGVECVRIYAAE
jgi:hypothetical protein